MEGSPLCIMGEYSATSAMQSDVHEHPLFLSLQKENDDDLYEGFNNNSFGAPAVSL